jgi:hypothetical protein
MQKSSLHLLSKKEELTLGLDLTMWVEEHKQKQGVWKYTDEGETYQLVTLGERPHPGYSVAITGAEQSSTMLKLIVSEVLPTEDEIYIQMLTYPYLLFIAEGDVTVEVKSTKIRKETTV